MDTEAARSKASDPATPASELRELAATQPRSVRALVAQNPNAPLDLLLTLARRHPEQVARNPALELHLLLQPTLLRTAQPRVAIALAACAEAPASLLGLLADDPRPLVRIGAAQNPGCPPEALARLCADAETAVRDNAGRNPSTPPEVRALLRRAGADQALREADPGEPLPEPDLERLAALGPWAQALAAQNPGCTPALLQRLGGLPSSWQLAFEHPSATPELRTDIVTRWLEQIPLDLLDHPGLPPAALRRIADGHGQNQKFAKKLLDHPALDPTTARTLAARHLSHHPFAEWLVSRPRSDEALLAVALEAHPYWAVVPSRLLERGDLTPALWQKLATHGLPEVRLQVARRPELPQPTLLWMTGDHDTRVRQAAWGHPALPESWRQTLLRLGFPAGLLDTPPRGHATRDEDLGALLDGGPWLRSFVAQHRATPVAVLERLVDEASRGDEPVAPVDHGVNLRLALRRDLPPELLRRLLPRLRAAPLLRLVMRPYPELFVIEHVLDDERIRQLGRRGLDLLEALSKNPTASPAHRDAALAAAARLAQP